MTTLSSKPSQGLAVPTLYELELLARQAGEILVQGAWRENEVAHKSLIDLVTDVDRRSEAFILEQIRLHYPGHYILAEESGAQSGDQEHTWYVDPLDGTVNYAHFIPIYAVSLAYAFQGKVNLAVVFAPALDECFTAERGRGAWLNGKRLKVSATADLDHSLLVTGFPYNVRTHPTNLEYYRRLALLSQGVRRLGSAALDLCYVGAGRFDGYWEMDIAPWDVAAGWLVAEEAGAVVTRHDGQAFSLTPPLTILAANPQVHSLVKSVLLA
jgi:myo-inositol-1(or 4)-monophosphatase